MMAKNLLAAFAGWRDRGEALVLASVYETSGSTYSKAGAQMLIADNGDFQGMLSGGCLEGDLGARAAEVLRTGTAQTVTYDLGQDDEELWGLGVGCDGLIRIFLQPILTRDGYQPFTAMADALGGDTPQLAATVLESESGKLVAGDTLVTVADKVAYSSFPDDFVAPVLAAGKAAQRAGRSKLATLELDGETVTLLVTILRPPPRVLILGAGLDAHPVVRFVAELGWRATIQDHRSAYVDGGDFAGAEEVLCVPATELANAVDLNRFDAAIVMSHHLTSDREYLRALAKSTITSIGLLGPRERRNRLLDELGAAAGNLGDRVRGPAGMEIGASGPAAIALSIVAQMHLDLASAGSIGR